MLTGHEERVRAARAAGAARKASGKLTRRDGVLRLTGRVRGLQGVECKFYTVVREGVLVGLKLYDDAPTRDRVVDRQHACAQAGVAPKVLDVFAALVKGRMMFGYATELAVIARELHGADEIAEGGAEYRRMVATVERTLGTGHQDMHDRNYGRMADGRAVCIDFGDCSIR